MWKDGQASLAVVAQAVSRRRGYAVPWILLRDLNIAVPEGGGVYFSCAYSMSWDACADPDNACCATFGGHVETQEHCNAFVYYYPKLDDATCF